MIPEEDLLQLKNDFRISTNEIKEQQLRIKDIYYINNVNYVECSFEHFHKVDVNSSFKYMYDFCKGMCDEKSFIILLDKYVYIQHKYRYYINFGLFIVYSHLYKTYEDFDLSEYNTYVSDDCLQNLAFITNVDSNYYIDNLSQCCNYIRRTATEKFIDDGYILVDIFDFLDSDGSVVMSLPYFCTTNDTSSYDEKVKILQKILLFTHSDDLEILCAAQCKYKVKEYKLIEVLRKRKGD